MQMEELTAEVVGKMSKFFRIPDDLNRLVDYINDLRLIVITITITAYVCGIGYLCFMCFNSERWKKKSRRSKSKDDEESCDVGSMKTVRWSPGREDEYSLNRQKPLVSSNSTRISLLSVPMMDEEPTRPSNSNI